MTESDFTQQLAQVNRRQPCPCGSGKRLARCCLPLLSGEQRADSAEQLMRSRYTAYGLQLVDYIIATTHPVQQPELDKTSMSEWAQSTRWHKLQVLSTEQGQPGDSEGVVEFSAQFTSEGDSRLQRHHERSQFICLDSRWYFVDPNTPLT